MELAGSFPILAALFAVFATLLYSFLSQYVITPWLVVRRLRAQGIPGYPYRPFIGNLKELFRIQKARANNPEYAASTAALQFLVEGTKEKGKVWFWTFGIRPRVVLADPALVRTAYISNNDKFPKPKIQRVARILGEGLVTSNGELWSKQRRLINPAFHMVELKKLYEVMVECTLEAMDRWETKAAAAGGKSLPMDTELCELTLEIICKTAFGAQFNGEEEKRKLSGIAEAFNRYNNCMESALPLTFAFPLYPFIPTPSNREMWRREAFLRKTMTEIISNRIRHSTGKKTETTPLTNGNGSVPHKSERTDLLQLMLDSTEGVASGSEGTNGVASQKHECMSVQQLMDESLTFLLAGHETTATLMTWTMVLLSQHPEWQEKAREEALRFKGSKGKDWAPSFEEVNEMKVIGCILNEALRLFPPAAALSRNCFTDVVLSEKVTIPAGCDIMVPIEVIQRLEDLWGKDALQFNPDRFAEGTTKAASHPGAFMPFTIGPRVCIGQNFALVEAKLILSELVTRFSWMLAPDYVHHPTTILTVKPKFGMPVILTPLK